MPREAPSALYRQRFLQATANGAVTTPGAPGPRHPEKHRAAGISAGTESGPPSGAWRSVRGFGADGEKTPKCPVSSQTGRTSLAPAFSSGTPQTACQIGSTHRHPAEGAIPYAEYLRIICVDRKRALDLSIDPVKTRRIPLAVTALMALVLLSGCSGSPPPDVISQAVDWQLRQTIGGGGSNPLFQSYQITNKYVEDSTVGNTFVYDYEAKCIITGVQTILSESGGQRSRWYSDPSLFNGTLKSFDGSVGLIKKGNAWYFRNTER